MGSPRLLSSTIQVIFHFHANGRKGGVPGPYHHRAAPWSSHKRTSVSPFTNLFQHDPPVPNSNPKPTKIWSPIKTIQKVNFTLPKKTSPPNSTFFPNYHPQKIRSNFRPFTIQGTCWCSPPHFHCWDPDSPSRIVESNPSNPPCWSGRPWWNDPSNDNTTCKKL